MKDFHVIAPLIDLLDLPLILGAHWSRTVERDSGADKLPAIMGSSMTLYALHPRTHRTISSA